MCQRAPTFTRSSVWSRGHGGCHDLGCVLRILNEYRNNLIDCHSIVMRMPAIVVCDHRDGDVTNLRFAGEFRFLQIGHADYVGSPTAIDVRLSLGGKLRTFHANVRAAEFRGDAGGGTGSSNHRCHFVADGIAESDVGDDAIAEKGVDAMASAIEELRWDHEIQRLVFFLQRADGGNGNDAIHSQLLEAVNVGTKVEFAGQQLVAASVAGEKSDFASLEGAYDIGVGRVSEGRLQVDFVRVFKTGHVVQATAADDADLCLLFHCLS